MLNFTSINKIVLFIVPQKCMYCHIGFAIYISISRKLLKLVILTNKRIRTIDEGKECFLIQDV